jgi:hypothetical protein
LPAARQDHRGGELDGVEGAGELAWVDSPMDLQGGAGPGQRQGVGVDRQRL